MLVNTMSDPYYYIEFIQIDNQVKVTAIDPETGQEASTICPGSTSRKDMSNLAIKKLRYILKKPGNE